MCSGLNRSAISLLKECGLSFTLISINIEPLLVVYQLYGFCYENSARTQETKHRLI